MRPSYLFAASAAVLSIGSQAFASEIVYSTQGAVNRFNATQSGVDNRIGAETEGNGGYIYPWDYDAAQQVGVNNTANVTQNGVANQANFKQGRDNVHAFDAGILYDFGSVSEALFNTLNLSQSGQENTALINQMGNHNWADTAQSGSLNVSTTEQWGHMDIASTSQFGVENTSFITQSDFNGVGGEKSASVFQNGNSNYAYLNQYEDYYSTISPGAQVASINQAGSGNQTTVYQTGRATLDSRIGGDNNMHTINQRLIAPFASENAAEVSSFGDFNNVSLTQSGLGGNSADIRQDGDQNAVTLAQNRQDGFAMITQSGSNNMLNLTQNGVGNSFQISMVGSSHAISLTQY